MTNTLQVLFPYSTLNIKQFLDLIVFGYQGLHGKELAGGEHITKTFKTPNGILSS